MRVCALYPTVSRDEDFLPHLLLSLAPLITFFYFFFVVVVLI